MKAVRLLAWRRLRAQPLRALVAALTVAAGVSVAVAVLIVLGSLRTSVHDAGAALAGPTPLRVIGPTSRGGIDAALATKVRSVDGVAAAIPLVQGISMAEGADGHESPVMVLGLDCSAEALVGPFGCTDAALQAADAGPPFAAPALLEQLGGAGTLRTNIGRVDLRDAIAVPGLAALNGGRAVAFPLARAQRELTRNGAVDVIYIEPAPGEDVGALHDRVQAAIGDTYSVLDATEPPPVVGVVLVSFLPLFTIIAALTLAVGGVLVYNSVTLSVEERRRQLAIISALGASSRSTVAALLLEAGAVGLLGGLLGAVGGALVARPITTSISDFTERVASIPLKVQVAPSTWVVAVALGVIVSLLAAARPARRALRVDVAAELANRDRREEAAAAVSTRRIVVLSAIALVGAGLCAVARRDGGLEPWQLSLAPLAFIMAVTPAALLIGAVTPRALALLQGFAGRRSAPVRLGLGNLLREPRRTGVMAVALGLAVSTGFVTASFGASVRHAISENLRKNLDGVSVSALDPGNSANIDTRITPETLTAIAALPGVEGVERGSVVIVGRSTGSLVVVSGYDNTYFDAGVLSGTIDRDRYAKGEVLIGPGLARRLDLRGGSTLSLETPHGPVELPVQAVIADGDSGGNNVTMSYDLLTSIYGEQPSTAVNVRPTAGTTAAELKATIEGAGLDPRLQVRTADELAAQIGDAVQAQLAPFDALQRALLVMAFIAVLSTMLLAGVQRRRELGLLAAIGMRPGEIGRMVAAEAAFVAVVGSLVGLVSGIFLFATLLLITPVFLGYDDPFVLDWRAGVGYVVVAVIVALAAAAWPAWRSARAEVLPALQYE